MLNKEQALDMIRQTGKADATVLQTKTDNLTGTQLNEEAVKLPTFKAACQLKNMSERPIGFVCKSSMGRVVKLLQPYDSTVYTQEPEELPAQWGFVWSQDPKHALPFIALSTSAYNKDDCCTYEEHVWRSGIDNNVWAPGTPNVAWEDLGTIADVIGG